MFWVGLSLKMGMSVSRCQKEFNSADFAELIAYNNLNPFMIDRSEYMLATLCALTANINSKAKQYTRDDFLLQQAKKVPQSSQMMEKQMEALYGPNK
jgi:hypothetical protein